MSDYGRVRSWESFTYAIGCLTLGWIFQAAGIGWAMPAYAIASLLVFVWSFTAAARHASTRSRRLRRRLGTVGAVFREAPRFWWFLAALFLVWTGFNAAWNFISLKIASEGGGPLLVGIGTAVGGLIEVPMMRSSSRLQARLGLRRVYALGCAIYAIGFLLWGSVSNPTIVSLLTVLEGVAFSMLFTTGVVVVGRLLPSTLYSTGNSVAQMVGVRARADHRRGRRRLRLRDPGADDALRRRVGARALGRRRGVVHPARSRARRPGDRRRRRARRPGRRAAGAVGLMR